MNDQKTIRLQKLENIKKQGIDPYPAVSSRTHTIETVVTGIDLSLQALAHLDLEKLSSHKKLILAGRIRSIRKHGGSIFCHIEDGTAKIQVYLKKDVLDKCQMSNVKCQMSYKFFLDNFDVGDFIEVSGVLFITKKGEKTLLVESYRILAKALLPLPEKWHGLEDVEIRFRKRYLDLLANPEVKKRFLMRSKIISLLRQFFLDRDYIEVETPILQPIYGGGLARPFKTHHNALDMPLYLRISTELYLKRLNVGGFDKVFEIGKVFRNEGVDPSHNPEFTMFETMECYAGYEHNMDLVEELYEHLCQEIFKKTEIEYQGDKLSFKRPWKRLTLAQAVKNKTGVDYFALKSLKQAQSEASKICPDLAKDIKKIASIGEIIAFLFEEKVEQCLIQPTIIYKFPVETSPLAKKCPDDSRFAERFEHFINGKEAGNHYTELNDPQDLRQRFIEEKKKLKAGFDEAHQTDDDFLEAIEYGLPPTSGIGIGIDRLVMLFTNSKSIKEVIFFPTMRPSSKAVVTGHCPVTTIV